MRRVQPEFQIRARNGAGAAAEARATPTTRSLISALRFIGAPAANGTYGAGELVRVEVEHNRPITVAGDPQLALAVGNIVRQASKERVSSNAIRFAYLVQAADADADGIGISATALALNGATTITGGDGAAAQTSLAAFAFTADAGHKVDGSSATTPWVDAVAIASTPAKRHQRLRGGELVEVEVRFSANVPVRVYGAPRLQIITTGGRFGRRCKPSPASRCTLATSCSARTRTWTESASGPPRCS